MLVNLYSYEVLNEEIYYPNSFLNILYRRMTGSDFVRWNGILRNLLSLGMMLTEKRATLLFRKNGKGINCLLRIGL